MSNPNKKISKNLSPARQLALRTMLSMQARREKAQAALNLTLGAAPQSTLPEDKALATELVYGCIRLEIRLDWILDQEFNKPEGVPLAMRRVMRMAVYELAYLTHIPSYATLNSYVNAIKAGYGSKLAGLANAVLRKISQVPQYDEAWFKQKLVASACQSSPASLKASNLPNSTDLANPSLGVNIDSAELDQEFMRIWYSLPLWLLNHFISSYPPDLVEQYLAASIEAPPLGLRLNRLNENFSSLSQTLLEEPGLIQQHDKMNEAVVFHSGFMPQNFGRMLAEGQMTRQSYAAQQAMQQVFAGLPTEIEAALALGPIWDVCAGQGGKTCWMLEQGLPVAASCDTSLSRLHGLAREIKRLQLPAPAILAADASKALPLKGQPGIILADAPCSGLGTLARRPDIKMYRTPSDLPALATLQQKITTSCFSCLPIGGLLIYLTCTLNPAENQEIIANLLQKQQGAKQIFTWATPANSLAKEFFWVSVLRKDS